MGKKIIAFTLTAMLILSFAGCGNSESNAGNDSNSASENTAKSSDNSAEAKLVGRWEQGYLTNSDDASFEQYDSVVLGYEKKFIELYSNGKGCTNYYVGDYCNGDSVVFEWKIEYDDFHKTDLLNIYYAVEEDECDEFGFRANESLEKNLYFKNAKIEGIENERDMPVEEYDTPIDTVSFRFWDYHLPFVKVDNFTDNVNLGCENAFKSIESYIKDPDAYDAQFDEE